MSLICNLNDIDFEKPEIMQSTPMGLTLDNGIINFDIILIPRGNEPEFQYPINILL